jgi:diguanylate cyclase (GGDEF)-like protein
VLSVRHLLGALAVSAAAIGGIVWFAADVQHDAVRHGAEEIRRVQLIEEDVQRVEAAARGYLVTRETRFLDELTLAREELAQAVDAVVEQSQGDDEEVESITRQQALIRQWSRLVNRDVDGARGGADVPASATLARERLVQSLRAENQLLLEDEQREANAYTDRATRVLVMLVLAASAVIGTIGLAIVLWARRRREGTRVREREERESQQEFAETMQVTRNETEAHRLLKRHLERVLPGSSVVVLNRNNSKNRLEATTPVESEGLAQRLVDSTPDSCLAVRLGRTYQRRSEREPLMSCELCGETTSTCVPSLVGGEVIGSVLVRQPRDLTPHEHDRVTMSVAQAAPVLANLRNLALAEIRAATDVLTGLPNKRALEDALKRQLAQASRAVDPLAVCMLDLDHFKKVNDVHGHERGDDVLAAVGDVIADTIRDSDFAGRFGGEEFLVLLPRTDVQGAKTIAEKLRTGRACPGSTAPSPRASASPCFPTTPSTGRPSCVSPTAPSTRPRREDGTSSAGSATAYWPTGTAHTPTCRPRRTTTSPRRPSELNLTDAAGRSGSHRGGRGGRRGYQHRWS